MAWQIINEKKNIPKLNNPTLLVGMPGIGNVGKIAIDFIISESKAKKLCSFFSHSFPHTVYVNEKHLVELPSIDMYYKKNKSRDLVILTGDVQPIDEISSYEFCDKVLEYIQMLGIKEIITTGGIGLNEVPEKPRVYITGNNKSIIDKYSSEIKVETKIHGIVGPIIGVSGLLVGLSKMKNIGAVALLAETFGNPAYVGVKGAIEILEMLNSKLKLKLNINKISSEIDKVEKGVKSKNIVKQANESSYIG